MEWEHDFAFAKDGVVSREEFASGVEAANRPPLPMSIEQYIFEMGRAEGYQFCGGYPKQDGFVIVMKRTRPAAGAP